MAYPQNVTGNATNLYQAERWPPSTLQTLAAATTIAPNGNMLPVSSAAAILLTATPTITASYTGHHITIINEGTFPIGFQDQSAIASTLRLLGGKMVILRQYQSLNLVYDSSLSAWVQRSAFDWPQGQNFNADTPPNTANAMDDEFDDSPGMSGTVNGLNARWTWRNQSTATTTFTTQGWLTLSIPAAAANALRGIEQTLPVGDWTFDALIGIQADRANNCDAGLWLVDGVNGDIYMFILESNAVASLDPPIYLRANRFTNVTTYNSEALTAQRHPSTRVYLRIAYTSGTTTLVYSYSSDGISWVRMGSFVDAVVVTKIGIVANESANTGRTAAFCDYFRRTA